MKLHELIAYCQQEGISHKLEPRGDLNILRVLDLTQLPMLMREYFDVQSGYYNRPLVVIEEPIPEPVKTELIEQAGEAPEVLSVDGEGQDGGEPEFNDDLPDDFPGRTALAVEGINTFTELRAAIMEALG